MDDHDLEMNGMAPISVPVGGQTMNTQIEPILMETEQDGPVVQTPYHTMDRRHVLDILGFQRIPLMWNEQRTGKDIIVKGDRFVTVQSPTYCILPNEYVASGADDVAGRLGLKLQKSVQTETRMWRYYLHPGKDMRFGPNKELDIGFMVANSIDGSQALTVSAYLFRQICSNGMMAKRLMVGLRMTHSSGMETLDFELLLKSTAQALRLAQNMGVSMADWAALPLADHPQGELFISLIKHSTLPNTMRPEYLQLPNKRLLASEIPAVDDTMSLWEVYNDVTAIISHSDVSERTKVEYQSQLHKALSPLYNLNLPEITA